MMLSARGKLLMRYHFSCFTTVLAVSGASVTVPSLMMFYENKTDDSNLCRESRPTKSATLKIFEMFVQLFQVLILWNLLDC